MSQRENHGGEEEERKMIQPCAWRERGIWHGEEEAGGLALYISISSRKTLKYHSCQRGEEERKTNLCLSSVACHTGEGGRHACRQEEAGGGRRGKGGGKHLCTAYTSLCRAYLPFPLTPAAPAHAVPPACLLAGSISGGVCLITWWQMSIVTCGISLGGGHGAGEEIYYMPVIIFVAHTTL